jgi:hypothetical protein
MTHPEFRRRSVATEAASPAAYPGTTEHARSWWPGRMQGEHGEPPEHAHPEPPGGPLKARGVSSFE